MRGEEEFLGEVFRSFLVPQVSPGGHMRVTFRKLGT